MPNKLIDLTGKRFGSWEVVERDKDVPKGEKPRWICRCDCGSVKSVGGAALRAGHSLSCGSCKGNLNPLFVRYHSNRLYHAWSEMIRRCTSKNVTNHAYYMDKGISVCDQWKDFDSFARWSIENEYQDGLEIDRIDSDGDYSPDNCRWVTHKVNSRNRKARSNNKTGYAGIQTRTRKDGSVAYRVTISRDGGGKVNIGTFNSFEDAYKARRQAELDYWGFNISR